MTLPIWGAGMVGLLAARILKTYDPVIFEAQSELPHNHEALLRFRDDRIAELTGIPFKKVKVLKGIWHEDQLTTTPDLRLANMYSRKTNGTVRGRSIIDLSPTERWIAPKDFVERLSQGVQIQYGHPLTQDLLKTLKAPSVSTIPMPLMMRMSSWPEIPEFAYRSIWAVTAEIINPECDVYQTLYFPGTEPYYRASITGNRISVEFQTPCDPYHSTLNEFLDYILESFGIYEAEYQKVQIKEQKFGKLVPIDDTQRRAFIIALSEAFSVFSLGRFATWKPNVLMHHIPDDLSVIRGFLEHQDVYGRKLAMLKALDMV